MAQLAQVAHVAQLSLLATVANVHRPLLLLIIQTYGCAQVIATAALIMARRVQIAQLATVASVTLPLYASFSGNKLFPLLLCYAHAALHMRNVSG